MSAPLLPSFPDVLDSLYRDQHTGPVTIHFAQGVPIVVEFPEAPLRIRLARAPLDRRDVTRADLTQNYAAIMADGTE